MICYTFDSMKLLHVCLFALLVLPSAHADGDTEFTLRRFEGRIGEDLPVSLFLTRLSGDSEENEKEYSGYYYYHRRGLPISLEMGEAKDGGKLVLREPAPDDPGKPDAPQTYTGIWILDTGEGSSLHGVWKSGDGKRTLPVSLKEAYPDGSFRFQLHHLGRDHHLRVNGNTGGEERSLKFPQIDADTPAARRINAAIRRAVSEVINGEDEDVNPAPKPPKAPNIEQIRKRFFDQAVGNDSLGDDDFPRIYSYHYQWSVVTNDDGVVSLEFMWDDYTGGAHGNFGFGYFVFDAATGEQVQLEDIALAGFRKRWAELGGRALRKAQGLKADAPLSEAGLFEDTLELNDAWCALPEGIQFSYDPYEIGPYALGQIAFTLPWKDILPDLKPGTSIHAFAKKRAALAP